jgi:hypothetical protein
MYQNNHTIDEKNTSTIESNQKCTPLLTALFPAGLALTPLSAVSASHSIIRAPSLVQKAVPTRLSLLNLLSLPLQEIPSILPDIPLMAVSPLLGKMNKSHGKRKMFLIGADDHEEYEDEETNWNQRGTTGVGCVMM